MTSLVAWSRACILATAFAFAAGWAHAEEYRLGRGDTLAVAVLGYPDLTRKAIIDSADEISLPFLGKIKAGGRTTADVREVISRLLDEKNIIRGSEVTVEIADYAPVYISGDVTKPGAFGFRPGITIRHAVALAGGYSARLEGVSQADLWGQQGIAAIALVKSQARLARLQAELADQETVTFSDVDISLVSKRLADRLLDLENEQFTARRQDRRREVAHLKSLVEQVRRQIVNLESQLKAEEQNIRSLSEDLDRMKSLFERRIAAANRLSDAQQALALNRARFFTTGAQLAEVRRLELELERKAQRYGDTERLKLMAEVQEALLDADSAKARLTAARMKIEESRAQGLPRAVPDVELRIFRAGSDAGLPATEGMELRSGDVVEVRLAGDTGVGEPRLRRQPKATEPAN